MFPFSHRKLTSPFAQPVITHTAGIAHLVQVVRMKRDIQGILCIATIANLPALNMIAKGSHTSAHNHATPVGMLKTVRVIPAALMRVVVRSRADVGDKVDNPVDSGVKVVPLLTVQGTTRTNITLGTQMIAPRPMMIQ